MRTHATANAVALIAATGLYLYWNAGTPVADANPPEASKPPATVPPASGPSNLIVHEWGTFTSFSGSDGVPVRFRTSNAALPHFVYSHTGDPKLKAGLLERLGTVSMETPVMYFYSPSALDASIRIDFPRGWITEWYPHAATPPDADQELSEGPGPRRPGEKICWKIKLLPGEALRFPREKAESIYYFAREAESVPIQSSFDAPKNSGEEFIRGGGISQYEKFLFYRGVGDFSPPVSIRALGAGKVRVMNSSGGTATCLVLLTVSDGKIGFRPVDDLPSGAETIAELPQAAGRLDDLIADVKRGLIAAGLYEREAAAMIETWKDAWFREGGTRLLYTVPRVRTDELLPLSINPQPKQVVRVLVGRNDFLTPEQEAMADRRTASIRGAKAEIASAEAELAKLGRFAAQARELAARRLEAKDPK